MFEISENENGEVLLRGRLDAVQAPRAQEFLDGRDRATVLDLAGLEYISSAGLGVLLRVHKRLVEKGTRLRLTRVSPHLRDIFRYSGFDRLFVIDPEPDR